MADDHDTGKTRMENDNTKHPLDPKGANPSENSALHAMTGIQSSVTPEQYPAAERAAQVEAATGRPAESAKGRDPAAK